MKAVQLFGHGGIDDIRLSDAPMPEPGEGQVLVRVKAAGINPVDWKIAEGLGKDNFNHALPHTLGCDVSGVITKTGPQVADLNVGDDVFGFISLQRGGGYAQYALAEPWEMAIKPAKLTHELAAAMPVAALTAYHAMFDDGHLEANQRVLIHAASGGVGTMAVQLARQAGAYVIATASARNEAYVRNLGADEFIDYRSVDFQTRVSDVDLVLDAVGGKTQEQSFTVLKPHGHLISIVNPPSPQLAEKHQVHAMFSMVEPDGPRLAHYARMVVEDQLKITIARTFPLDQAVQALRESKAGHTVGKLVVTVD